MILRQIPGAQYSIVVLPADFRNSHKNKGFCVSGILLFFWAKHSFQACGILC
jgi:hypothetical protein